MNLIENVKYKVCEFTGLEIKKINIFVEGVQSNRLTGTYIYIDSYILIIADRRKVCHLPLYRRNGGKLWQPIQ